MRDNEVDHFSVKPFSLRDIPPAALKKDSARLGKNWARHFWTMPDSNSWIIDFTPLFVGELGVANEVDEIYTAAPGVALHLRYGAKMSLYADFVGGAYQGPIYIQQFIDTAGVLPSWGKNQADLGSPAFILPSSRLSYAPSEYFQFELG